MTFKLKLRFGSLANHHLSSQLCCSAGVEGLALTVSRPTVAQEQSDAFDDGTEPAW